MQGQRVTVADRSLRRAPDEGMRARTVQVGRSSLDVEHAFCHVTGRGERELLCQAWSSIVVISPKAGVIYMIVYYCITDLILKTTTANDGDYRRENP